MLVGAKNGGRADRASGGINPSAQGGGGVPAYRKGGAGAAAFCGSGALWAPDPQNQRRGRGPRAPAPCVVRAVRARRPPFRQGFPPTPKRQRKSPAPQSMGPGKQTNGKKGRGDGSAPLGKAAAHALRAAAASSAPPRATGAGQPRPLLRDYRRPRRTA